MVGQLAAWACDAAGKRLPSRLGRRSAETGRKHPSGRSGGRPTEASRMHLLDSTVSWLILPGDHGLLGRRNRLSDPVYLRTDLSEILPCGLGIGVIGAQYSFPLGLVPLKQWDRLGGPFRVLIGRGEVLPCGLGIGVIVAHHSLPV